MIPAKLEDAVARRLFQGKRWDKGNRAESWWGVGQVIREMNDRGWTVEIRVSGGDCEVLCRSRRASGMYRGASRKGGSTEVPAVVAACAMAVLGEPGF